MKKLLAIVIGCGIVATSLAQETTLTVISPDYEAPVWAFAISSNGRYLACYLDGQSAIVDMTSDDLNDLDAYILLDEDSEFTSISDAGTMVGWADAGGVAFNTAGEISTVTNSYGNAYPTAITADEARVCGYAVKSYNYKPCIWRDGEQSFLTTPELSFESDGAIAYCVSDDGQTIVGMAVDNYNTRPMIIWHLQDDGTYAVDAVCEQWFKDPSDFEYNEDTDELEYNADNTNPYFYFLPRGISRNGKYISLALTTSDWELQMGRYDVATGEMELATGYYEPQHVADDGTIVGWYVTYASTDYEYAAAMIWRPGEEPQLIADAYPQHSELAVYDGVGYNRAVDITPDGRYIIGIAYAYFDEDTLLQGSDCYARDITWVLDTTGADGIKVISSPSEATSLQSQQTTIYNLAGQQLTRTTKGLNIVGGKKVVK